MFYHPQETRTQLVFITEPVFASLADLLQEQGSSLPPALAQERRSQRLSGWWVGGLGGRQGLCGVGMLRWL